jgi:hypothetical protein
MPFAEATAICWVPRDSWWGLPGDFGESRMSGINNQVIIECLYHKEKQQTGCWLASVHYIHQKGTQNLSRIEIWWNDMARNHPLGMNGVDLSSLSVCRLRELNFSESALLLREIETWRTIMTNCLLFVIETWTFICKERSDSPARSALRWRANLSLAYASIVIEWHRCHGCSR